MVGWNALRPETLTETSGAAADCTSCRIPLDSCRVTGALSLASVLLLLLLSWFDDFFDAFRMFGFGLSSTFDFFVTLSVVPCDCDT